MLGKTEKLEKGSINLLIEQDSFKHFGNYAHKILLFVRCFYAIRYCFCFFFNFNSDWRKPGESVYSILVLQFES